MYVFVPFVRFGSFFFLRRNFVKELWKINTCFHKHTTDVNGLKKVANSRGLPTLSSQLHIFGHILGQCLKPIELLCQSFWSDKLENKLQWKVVCCYNKILSSKPIIRMKGHEVGWKDVTCVNWWHIMCFQLTTTTYHGSIQIFSQMLKIWKKIWNNKRNSWARELNHRSNY